MKAAYPVILSPAQEGGFVVYVPGIEINTQGETLAESMEMARDAIGLWGICQQDMGNEIPDSISVPTKNAVDDIITFVDVDFDTYRRMQDMRTVKKNVTIPSYLNDLAIRAGINFSQVLQEGLKTRLGI